MLPPARVTEPADTPVSLEECKAHCNVTHADDDSLIGVYLSAAVDRLDGRAGILNRCLVDQSWRQDFGCWPADRILRLPFPDVSSVTGVAYSDETDAEQTLSASDYTVHQDAKSAFVRLKNSLSLPGLYDDRLDPVRVTFVAGYGPAASVPYPIKAAILLLVSHFYEHREEVIVGQGIDGRTLPMGVMPLVKPYRRVGL